LKKLLNGLTYPALIIILLAGCSNDSSIKTAPANSDVEIANPTDDNKSTKEEQTRQEDLKDETVYVEKGETKIIDDFAEITIVDTAFSKKIEPPNPDSFYTYYEAKDEGTIYLDTILTIKSLLTSAEFAEDFADVEVLFNGKYEYLTFSTIEERGGSDFTYSNITLIEPLKSGTLHFLAEIPEEVANSSDPLIVTIHTKDQSFNYKIR